MGCKNCASYTRKCKTKGCGKMFWSMNMKQELCPKCEAAKKLGLYKF
jgi:hypothetical protein